MFLWQNDDRQIFLKKENPSCIGTCLTRHKENSSVQLATTRNKYRNMAKFRGCLSSVLDKRARKKGMGMFSKWFRTSSLNLTSVEVFEIR